MLKKYIISETFKLISSIKFQNYQYLKFIPYREKSLKPSNALNFKMFKEAHTYIKLRNQITKILKKTCLELIPVCI